MRYLVGCLAIIGVFVILAVGGCFGMIAYGFSTLPEIPAGLTKEAVERRYADTIELVRVSIAQERLSALRKNREVIAVYRSKGTETKDIYLCDPTLTKTSHHLRNGAGIATMKSPTVEARCIAYDLKIADDEYLVILPDAGLGTAAKPVP